MKFSSFPKKVEIIEVGPRDGLQNEKTVLKLEDKLLFIHQLIDSGLKTIEATSFVRPDKIPQMNDASELFPKINPGDSELLCLVPNLKGLELAKRAGAKRIALFTATSESFNKKNINASIDESFERIEAVACSAIKDGISIRGYISTAFGCPYEGKTSIDSLKNISERMFKLGANEVSIGDTIGIGTPSQVDNILTELSNVVDLSKVAMHFHDTRGMALANVLVSLEHGIKRFDSSAGGLGGCPYAKGATGNVATEDLLYLFDSLGIETGVNLKMVAKASSEILKKLKKETTSKFLKTYLNQ